MKQNIKVEAEHNELILENSHGDKVIIPANKRNWVKQKLSEGCHNCIDSLVETLPIASQYAQDGSVYPPNAKVKVNHNNQIKEYDISSPEYKDLYNTGKLMNYDKNTDTYIATPLKEVTVTAEAPQWSKDKRNLEKQYKENEINYQSENPVNNINNNEEITSSYLKDRQFKKPEKLEWYNTFNYKKWGLNDYSDYSSFNSAFRNSRESGEKEFVYKGNRYNTNLISREQSDLYHESKKFLEDYYKNQDYKPLKTELPYNIKDIYMKEKFGKTWGEYYDEVKDSDDYKFDTENTYKVHSELAKLDPYDENNFNNKDYKLFIENFLEKQKKEQKNIELNNLKEPYYFSITDEKPKDMAEDGYLDGRNKKIFLTTNAHKGKLNTTYIHELSHKADDYDVYKRIPKVDLDKINKAKNPYKLNQELYDYVSDPSEIEARKFSILFYLYKNKQPYTNISEKQLEDLYDKADDLPYDIKQLLNIYGLQRKDLLNYLNNNFEYSTK